MLNFPRDAHLAGEGPVDLGRSFDGLPEKVRQRLYNDPLSGHTFVFPNI